MYNYGFIVFYGRLATHGQFLYYRSDIILFLSITHVLKMNVACNRSLFFVHDSIQKLLLYI